MPQTLVRKFAPQFGAVQTQHADLEIVFPNGIFMNVTEISYAAKNSPEEARGTSKLSMGVTDGELKYECSMTIHRSFRDALRRAAMVPGKGLFEGFFTMTVSTAHADWGVETDTLACKITEWNFSSSAGPAVQLVTVPMYCGYIDFGLKDGTPIPQFMDILGS